MTCPQCRARFIGMGERSAEASLAAHTGGKHTSKPRSSRAEESATTVQRVVDEIRARIAAGSLAPGTAVRQGSLAAELGLSRHYVERAVGQLIAAGTLRWSGATSAYARRACVPLR